MSLHYSTTTYDTSSTLSLVPVQSHNLDSMLIGKWTIYKYQLNLQVPFLKSRIEFFSDGTFKSDGVFFGRKTGMFKTDENKFSVTINTEDESAEWRASFQNNGTLRLKGGSNSNTNWLTGNTCCLNLIKVNKRYLL